MAEEELTGITYLDVYRRMLEHQRGHGGLLFSAPLFGEREQPWWTCTACPVGGENDENDYMGRSVRKKFSFAVPDEDALAAIAKYSPNGVVEIGAGGGYWAMLLQQRGLDVVAYDPAPIVSDWHNGGWTAVHEGDHRAAAAHSTRTLLICWPSYAEPWAAEALRCYQGDTVVYIGEGVGGCTADDEFHALLGEPVWCWHTDDDGNEVPCPEDCVSKVSPLFVEVDRVAIPQWAGLHDELKVYRRV